ncbi:Alpha/Beta hydrolase protein [Kockovaella imperatae]|uniref:Alpha/Beta hydrolase protein n=1 Tax=Kockovaella imperatae TaxID=4999 RepID=A0A1Y1UCL9_9TREE|nr:Alpha/Beta hydrolase protein [Kockovaella imperatae]ORX35264.1 Alpha/Beta hydrolase protein [Kockovaella imperatae]
MRSILICLLLNTATQSIATARPTVRQDSSVTVLSASQISEWTIPAYLASAAYCPGNTIQSWNCGPACGNVSEPNGIVTGGDGDFVQRWFVAQTSDGTTVLSISGTNTSSIESIGIDIDFPLVEVDETFFPDSTGVELHQGFYGAFKRIQGGILAGVVAQARQGDILVVGHSLGAALTQITATYLQKQFPARVVTAKSFAPPRSGNKAWADYVDVTLGSNTGHMINYADDVPHLPPRPWHFQHASGEIWILKDGTTYEACGGRENPVSL